MDAPASTLPKLTAWLSALSTSPDYAIAFAQAYEALGGNERDAWLTELEGEHANAAAYWPLLAVEQAPSRLRRIRSKLEATSEPTTAYRDGDTIYLVRSMYSAFIGAVRFVFGASGEVASAHALPLCDNTSFRESLSAQATVIAVADATLDIARGVVVSRRLGRDIPELLLSHPELLDRHREKEGKAS